MALYKVSGADTFNGTLPLSAPIIPNEGHAKYVCLDPWVNALVTLASLGTIVAFLIVRCRKCTLCRGLEYATACHIYVFISRNDRYSPIKLPFTTGLLYNFVTNQRLPIEAIELHRGCLWDSMCINWGEVTLTNGDTKIRLPYNVQIPIREKSRLCSLMKGSDCTAHLMVLQEHTWSTQYVRANEDSEDGQETDEEGDIEAPYLAPKQTPVPKPSQDEPIVQAPSKEKNPPAEDSQDSSREESIPELIDLREGEEVPPPSLLKKANCPTTLGLHERIVVTSEKLPAFSFPPSQGSLKALPAAAPEIHPEEVPEEQIIYIDDDVDPSLLCLLERQVDHLLMPPPSDTTPMAQKGPKSPSRDHQLPRMPERKRCSPAATGKKTLQERQNGKSLKLKVCTVAKMHTGLVDIYCAQELAKLTNAVVPLQRLKIQDDTPIEVPKSKPEVGPPTPSPK